MTSQSPDLDNIMVSVCSVFLFFFFFNWNFASESFHNWMRFWFYVVMGSACVYLQRDLDHVSLVDLAFLTVSRRKVGTDCYCRMLSPCATTTNQFPTFPLWPLGLRALRLFWSKQVHNRCNGTFAGLWTVSNDQVHQNSAKECPAFFFFLLLS